jgi:phosphoglycerate dehydrogenase-like enzyme
VFATEPLPEDSPLWSMPNVIVTPHSSGASPKSAVRAEKIFVENFRNYVNGQPLRNEVRP